METSQRARRWVAAVVSLLFLASAAVATPVATDIRKSTDESAEMTDVTAEAAPPPTVNPLDDARPKAASATPSAAERALQRRRNGKASFDDVLAGKPEAASAPRGTAQPSAQDNNPASVAVVDRMLETVRAPIGMMAATGDDGPAGASPNPRRRGELPVGVESNDSQRAAGSGDDAVVKAVRTAREILHEPLAWLLLVLVAGIALVVSHVTRQVR